MSDELQLFFDGIQSYVDFKLTSVPGRDTGENAGQLCHLEMPNHNASFSGCPWRFLKPFEWPRRVPLLAIRWRVASKVFAEAFLEPSRPPPAWAHAHTHTHQHTRTHAAKTQVGQDAPTASTLPPLPPGVRAHTHSRKHAHPRTHATRTQVGQHAAPL